MIDSNKNALLKALPEETKNRIFSQLTIIKLPLGMVIYEAGQNLENVYFPIDSIVSLLPFLWGGKALQIVP
jgi:CRP-like cAMP-binding protein